MDLHDAARREHTALRHRLISGGWRGDLYARMLLNLGTDKTAAYGEPDMSANPYDATCGAAAALYDLPPKQRNPHAPSLAAMRALTESAGLYSLMSSVQKDVIAMREELVAVRADLVAGQPSVVYEPIPLHLAELRPDPKAPSRPISVRWSTPRYDPTDRAKNINTIEVWSVDGVPEHRVLSSDGKTDLSHFYGLPQGGAVGLAYPHWRVDGRPVLPVALYHAAHTGRLLDPFYRQELIQGTLNVGVLWTYFQHCVRRGSHPQRWIGGGSVAGGKISADGLRREVASDPATVVEILRDPEFDGQLQVGQWGPASDPKAVAEAIGLYEARFLQYVGIPGADVTRRSANITSGYALAVDQAQRREAQRKYGPIFAPVDSELLSVTATVVNSAMSRPGLVGEDGWGIDYVAIPLTPEERAARLAEAEKLLGLGVISKAEARARILDEDIADAMLAIPTTPETPLVGIAQTVAQMVESVAAGRLPRDAGVALVARSMGISIEEAEPLVGSAGRDFVPKTI